MGCICLSQHHTHLSSCSSSSPVWPSWLLLLPATFTTTHVTWDTARTVSSSASQLTRLTTTVTMLIPATSSTVLPATSLPGNTAPREPRWTSITSPTHAASTPRNALPLSTPTITHTTLPTQSITLQST